MPPLPPNLAGSGLPFRVVVQADERSNSVVVVGRKEAVVLAAGLIAQLDRPSAELSYQPYVLSLKNVQASTMQEKLTELLDQRMTALGSKDKNAARDGAVIVAEERTNSLMVLASPEMHQLLGGLVREMDAAASYRIVDTRFRPLKFADAGKLQALLQELFDKKKQSETTLTQAKDEANVLADYRSNSLLIVGTRDYLEEAERLITQLDQQFEPTIEFKLRPILLNSAVNIAALITEMVEKSRPQGAQAQQTGTPIHVAADPYSNSLIIAASAEDIGKVERWVDTLDRPTDPGGRTVRIIPVRVQKAEQLATQAQNLFQKTGGAGGAGAAGGGGDVTVDFDATTNSVIAIGPPAVVRDIEEFLSRMNELPVTNNAIVRHFKLKQADAQNAGDLLANILQGRTGTVGTTGGAGGGGTGGGSVDENEVMLIFQRETAEMGLETLKAMRASIRVTADVRTNSLWVSAPPDSMPMMESLVAAVDQPPETAKVRVFTLRNSTAEQMVQTLRELFGQSSTGGTAGTRTAAGGQQQERVLTLGEGLDAGGRQQILFTTDVRTNSVIAAGTEGYLRQVEELVLQLDATPIPERITTVYQPRNAPAEALQTALEQFNQQEQQRLDQLEDISATEKMARQIISVPSPDTNQVIVSFDPRRRVEVQDLIRELDQPPPQVMIQVLVIEVTIENSLELGVEFAFEDLQYAKAGPDDTTTFDYVLGTDVGAAGSGLGGFTFTIAGKDFNFLLRTLQSEGVLNVLSRPQIVAMDNQEAKIDVSNDVPYVTGTSTSEGGQVTTSVNRERIGIILTVTPQINSDGFVRMQINQQVSDLTDSTVQIAPGVSSPIFLRREADTVVTVRDNETVVLGGLITSRESRTEQKIPIVGDFPLVGPLFRFQNTDVRRSELLLVLTPRIIRAVEDYRELSIQERDRTGMIPPEVLMHPLMNSLRVHPDQVRPGDGSVAPAPLPEDDLVPPLDDDAYGPRRPRRLENGVDPTSYDVPTRGARAAQATRGQPSRP
ncbi:MAG TPA: secretin N-terminal domain-containing protein [Phycisphaerae bacterium]|nr:secretin N-terminal domain-containing protein [Phycisphaerae bacterium]